MKNQQAYIMIPTAILDDLRLSANALRLYLHIIRQVDYGEEYYENRDQLARACRMSNGNITYIKRELVKAGWITLRTLHHRHFITLLDERKEENTEPGA